MVRLELTRNKVIKLHPLFYFYLEFVSLLHFIAICIIPLFSPAGVWVAIIIAHISIFLSWTSPSFQSLQGVHIQPEGLQLLLQRPGGGAVQPWGCCIQPLPLLERPGDDRQVRQPWNYVRVCVCARASILSSKICIELARWGHFDWFTELQRIVWTLRHGFKV